jgi:hypothetical protein
MTDLAEPLRPVRALASPKRFAPLRTFSCGRAGRPWEKGINKWVRDVYHGLETDHTILVMEDARGKLVGVCGIRPHPFSVGAGRPDPEAQRIHILATDRLYRGKRLEDGSRPGDVFLRGVLKHIKVAGGGRMPCVTALIEPENARSLAFFSRHGFGQLPYAGEGDIICVRPADRQTRWTAISSRLRPRRRPQPAI